MFGWGLRQKAKNIGIDRAQVFQMAYATRAWGSAESGSGTGSELAATENVSAYLPEL
jgi:hypothetical protein